MLRVFLISPLPAVRAGLRALLGTAADLEVVGEAAAPDDAGLFESAPDVVVVDAEADAPLSELLSDGGGRGPGLLILGPIPGDERLPDELAGRAWGYLPRDTAGDGLVAAARAVGSGYTVIEPRLGAHLFARLDAPTAGGPRPEGEEELTAREREVLQLVALGLANKSIASRLGISEHTVKFHVAAILGKLGAASRTEAVHLGARRGLVVL